MEKKAAIEKKEKNREKPINLHIPHQLFLNPFFFHFSNVKS